jgi:hypothetical protein
MAEPVTRSVHPLHPVSAGFHRLSVAKDFSPGGEANRLVVNMTNEATHVHVPRKHIPGGFEGAKIRHDDYFVGDMRVAFAASEECSKRDLPAHRPLSAADHRVDPATILQIQLAEEILTLPDDCIPADCLRAQDTMCLDHSGRGLRKLADEVVTLIHAGQKMPLRGRGSYRRRDREDPILARPDENE